MWVIWDRHLIASFDRCQLDLLLLNFLLIFIWEGPVCYRLPTTSFIIRMVISLCLRNFYLIYKKFICLGGSDFCTQIICQMSYIRANGVRLSICRQMKFSRFTLTGIISSGIGKPNAAHVHRHFVCAFHKVSFAETRKTDGSFELNFFCLLIFRISFDEIKVKKDRR